MAYVIEYDIAAAIIMTVLLVLYLLRKKFPNAQNGIFAWMLLDALAATLADILSVFLLKDVSRIPVALNYIVNCFYLLTYNMAAVLYFMYVLKMSRKDELRMADKLFYIVPACLHILLIGTTGWTHWIIYFDEQKMYHHGPLFFILYLLSLTMIVLSMIEAYRRRNVLARNQRLTVVFFSAVVLGGVAIQFFFPNVLIVNFFVSIHLVLVYLSLQNPEHYIEKETFAFNQRAFIEMLTGYFDKEKPFTVIAFSLGGFEYVNRVLGVQNGNAIINQIASFLQWNFPKKQVFHLQETEFVLLLPYHDDDLKKVARDIRHEFERPMVIKDDVEVIMTPFICTLSYPDMAHSVDDVMDAIQYSFNEARQSGNSEMIYASEDSLVKKRRETDITHIIKRAIHNDEFQVYYQPIYSTKGNGFESAEALVRLIDDDLGFISPEEFIPMAEQEGSILAIGEIIFEKVCKFLSGAQAAALGIHYIEVNLSVVQCMQKSLAMSLLEIMKKYNIASDQINLEITETANFDSDEILRQNMNTLIESGLTFSMDDYGTGFSTASYLIDLPFKLIKIDKSILWAAMEDEKAMVVLKHTVEMIKDLELQIVVEGVENQQMADILIEMGCDYLQGYNFSKPIPERNYVEFLKSHLESA